MQEEGKTFHKLHVLGMNDNLRDRVSEVGSETWKGCERTDREGEITSLILLVAV